MILVLLRHTPNPSSKFIDLDVEIPCARGTFDQFESTLYQEGRSTAELGTFEEVMDPPPRQRFLHHHQEAVAGAQESS